MKTLAIIWLVLMAIAAEIGVTLATGYWWTLPVSLAIVAAVLLTILAIGVLLDEW